MDRLLYLTAETAMCGALKIYTPYKDGGEYRLDITGFLFGSNMSYKVFVADRDNIVIKPGSRSEYDTGNFAVKLKRVQ